MTSHFRTLTGQSQLIWALTVTELTTRYKRAVFGWLWLFLNPVLQMLILASILSQFVNIPHYSSYLLTGLLPWQFVSVGLTQATAVFVAQRTLLHKSPFPRFSLPVAIVLAYLLHLLVALGLFGLYQLSTGSIALNRLWLILPAISWLSLFVIGCSLITSTLNVRYRDVGFFMQTLILLWFYATPIIYPLNQLPASLTSLFALNPLVTPIQWLHGVFVPAISQNHSYFWPNLGVSLLLFGIGIIIYKRHAPHLTDWV